VGERIARLTRASACSLVKLLGFAALTVTVVGVGAVSTTRLSEPAAAASAASCTAAQKGGRVDALKAFTRTMAARRRAYFRTHKGAKARQAFVKRQKATLKRLKAAAGCDVPQPPPTPAPTPGAAATYVFGSEVTAAQQSSLREGVDLGARFIRSALGRELAAFTVWGYNDLEALIGVYAATAPTPLDNSRSIWTRGTVASAAFHKLWVGPDWFRNSGRADGTKILVHETVHVLQSELAGDGSLNSGFDDIPRAGPRWISEGSAELVGYLAITNARLTNMPFVRSDWVQQTRLSPVTLQRLALLRGQFEAGGAAFPIMALAVDQLVGEVGLAKLVAYYTAIGRGDPWQSAFSSAFGKTIDTFYAEFDAFRRGL
jgi:hypothetical protein